MTKPVLTIEDLRNPRRASGFEFVTEAATDDHPSQRPFQARLQRMADLPGSTGRRGSVRVWTGPRRVTADEAAQDYCDYVNGRFIAPTFSLTTAGHPQKPRMKGTRKDGKPKARPRKKEGPGYVYLMGEVEDPNKTLVKIGESGDPAVYRLGGCQTGNGRKLAVLGSIWSETRLALEAELHRKFLKRNKLQEWFWSSREIFAAFDVKPPAGYKQPTMKEVPAWILP